MSTYVPLKYLSDNPWQTRQAYDEAYIRELADDMLRHGLLQAPTGRIVRVVGAGNPSEHQLMLPTSFPTARDGSPYDDQRLFDKAMRSQGDLQVQLAFGHNRRRAMTLITEWVRSGDVSESDLPPGLVAGCLAAELRPLSGEQMATLAWTENEQRKDLTPVEEALAIERRMDDFGWTQQEVATRLGIGRSTVANKLRLLKLPERVLEHLRAGELSERQALALVPAFDLPKELEPYAEEVSPTFTLHPEQLVRAAVNGRPSEGVRGSVSSYIDYLERQKVADETSAREDATADERLRANAEASPSDPQAPMSTDFAEAKKRIHQKETLETEPLTDAAEVGGDGVAEDPDLAATSTVPAEEVSDWPAPELDPVWRELGSMTKAELEETHRRFRHEQWGRYSDNFRTSALKDEQLEHVKNQIRFHANLEAVHRLTDEQAERLLNWMREQTEGEYFFGDRTPALRPANRILGSIHDVEGLGIMADDAFERFRLQEARRAGAFCYHLFYKEQVGESPAVAGPPTCEELRDRYQQATQMQGPEAIRQLKQIRADIGRRQGVVDDAQELDRLGDLHSDVDAAIRAKRKENAAAVA